MEGQHAFHEVVFFRCTALKRLQDEKKKVLQRKKSPWYRRVMGGAARARESGEVNPKFTCFTGTKVQILTLTLPLTRLLTRREGGGTRREGSPETKRQL